MKYVSVAEMIAIEQAANARGLTYPDMMENAGRGLAEVVQVDFNAQMEDGVLALVGSGNNGGDALVALAYLADWGWPVRAYLVRPRPADDPLVRRMETQGGEIASFAEDARRDLLATWLGECGLLLDGVFGTGIKLPLRGEAAEILAFVGEWLEAQPRRPVVIAVDCPSGVDCDSGQAAPETVPANLTVTMAAVKQGLLKFPAFDLVGSLQLVSIGLPPVLPEYDQVTRMVISSGYVRAQLPERPLEAHKGTFGTALIIAGSQHYSGAALLAGKAAYRCGAGLVTLGVPELLHAALAGSFSEATWLPLPHESGWIAPGAADVIRRGLERSTAMLLGPGFGVEPGTQEFLERFLPQGEGGAGLPPLVMDADGLKLLARLEDWPGRLPPGSVLTPHPGEMAVISGLDKTAIQENRVGVAEQMAQKWGHVLVLKGAFTVIAAPDKRTAIIPVASPALARAGTGDVLAGIITGLQAQGMAGFEAAAAGAWLHAQAGVAAEDAIGSAAAVLAGDLLPGLIEVLAAL